MKESSLVTFLATVFFLVLQLAVQADDWPQWRGPQRDNKSQETGLLKTWHWTVIQATKYGTGS